MGPIIIDLQGTDISAEEKELILHPMVGGIIFFTRNFADIEQISSLSHKIKKIKPECLLCVDQEGGRVQRFKEGFTKLPPLKVLGDLIEKGVAMSEIVTLSEQLGMLMALEVRSVGVDLSFAPVLDLGKGVSDVVLDRAIHASPEFVSLLATAYVRGMEKVGMQATGKHFPGHGSVKLDSHHSLPEDFRGLSEIKEDMMPFQVLIQEKIAAIMPAHIVYPEIDSLPVGFSPYWLKTILREQMQFQGAIISDDLSMAGATIIGDYIERTKQAITAGCDSVLICNNREGAISVLDNVRLKDNQESLARRTALLARGSSPDFSVLKKSQLWQEAASVLDILKPVLS
jgi:beta-N-acetylhexosaminidase